tara:strand:- start:2313 stop:3641 length:1329 start_codon:yes stop_codon:yes gene_type:complete
LKAKKKKLKSLSFTVKEGVKYSIFSGDKNKIHIDKKYGYDSIFGENIVHGTFLISKLLRSLNFNEKKTYKLDIEFKDPFFYDKEILIKKKKFKNHTNIFLFQENKKKGIVKILRENFSSFDKSFQLKKTKSFLFSYKNMQADIYSILPIISRFVGMIFPGENSLISKINIIKVKNDSNSFKNKIIIKSKIVKSGYPLIINRAECEDYVINFETLLRPKIKNIFPKKNVYLKNKILKLRDNVLILGASTGIGRSFLELLKMNKKIRIFATFNRSKIYLKSNNVKFLKVDVLKDLKKIFSIINNNINLRIFYFPTPKIFFHNELDKKLIIFYKKYYSEIPIEILRRCRNKNITFFYPSTKNIELDEKSIYSKIKLSSETKILNFCKKFKIRCDILRFPAIYSKQSITLLNQSPPHLFDYLNKNKEIIDFIFPTKKKNYIYKLMK